MRTEVLWLQHRKPLPGHLSYCKRHKSWKQDVLMFGHSFCNTSASYHLFHKKGRDLEFKATQEWGAVYPLSELRKYILVRSKINSVP